MCILAFEETQSCTKEITYETIKRISLNGEDLQLFFFATAFLWTLFFWQLKLIFVIKCNSPPPFLRRPITPPPPPLLRVPEKRNKERENVWEQKGIANFIVRRWCVKCSLGSATACDLGAAILPVSALCLLARGTHGQGKESSGIHRGVRRLFQPQRDL